MKRPLCLICLILNIFLIFRAVDSKSAINPYSEISNKTCTYEGTVKDIQYKSTRGNLTQILYLKGSPNIIVYMGSITPEPKIGSKILISGTGFSFQSARNEGMFDALTYYNSIGYSYGIKNGIIKGSSSSYNRFMHTLYLVRRYLSSKIDILLPEEEASIIKTMLLGQKKEIDNDIKELYTRNGIAHILSISGLHISMIGLGFFNLLKRLGTHHKTAAVISSIAIVLYGLMSGLSVSSGRAILMFMLTMGAIMFGRTYDMLTSVSLFSTIFMLTNSLLLYNSGFLFSFGIIYGISIILPTLTSVAASENKPSRASRAFLNSLSMAVISLPIYYFCYYQIPIYSIILNFLVLPVMSILMGGSFVMLTISCINISLGKPLAFLIIGILKFFKELAIFFDSLPFHYYTPGKPKLWQLIIFIFICVLLYLLKKRLKLYIRWLVMLGGILILTIRINPQTEICMLDVGQGESIFIRNCPSFVTFPGISKNFTALMDGGSSDTDKVGEYRIIPFLKSKGASTIDVIFISHTDKDHVNGILELIDQSGQEGLLIKSIVLPNISEALRDERYHAIEQSADKQNISLYYLGNGDILSYRDLEFRCLSPNNSTRYSSSNDSSLVIFLRYLGHSILLTGDISSEIENDLFFEYPIEILKVPHHGSGNSSSSGFLKMLRPSIAIISAGINNQYGHPHKETLERLNKTNTVILRTDLLGQLTLDLSNADSVVFSAFCDTAQSRYHTD